MCWTQERTVRRTRKPYRCEYCWQWIPAGELCRYQRGIADGAYFTARLHPECARELASWDYCETYMPGEGERPPVGPVQLSFAEYERRKRIYAN